MKLQWLVDNWDIVIKVINTVYFTTWVINTMDTFAGTEYKTHCNSSGTTFITLNCNDGEESNLQGCNPQFMRNSICSCTDGVLELHAKVVCKKGMFSLSFFWLLMS